MNDFPSPDTTEAVDRTAPALNGSGRPDGASRKFSVNEQALRILGAVIALLAILMLAQWWNTRAELHKLRGEVAGRLQAGDASNAETRGIARSLQDSAREVQARINVLEGRQAEAQSQQLALEQLYQELAKNRDDWALAEVEQVLSTASQQLQLAGNVSGALIALQNADARLARSDKGQFIAIRRAIAHDQERLKALPSVDLTGLALRLDSVIAEVDNMPLLSDEKPAAPVVQAPPAKQGRRTARKASTHQAAPAPAKADEQAHWLKAVADTWQAWTSEMWGEVRQLIRVREVDTPDALLLSPEQSYFVRENLKLRLLNARLALLSRNETEFRNDLTAAQDMINRYFNTHARPVQTAQTALRQMQNSNLTIQMPSLTESLNAVRNYKAKS